MAITTQEGSSQDYGYTGGMQSVVIPFEGIFRFEVWGAGGTKLDISGKGGYSVGYRLCNGGETFYICVGGSASRYNGGGWSNAGHGGGATHIATANALLRDLEGNKGAVLLVAGGGGGAGQDDNGTGGAGGGENGGNGNGASGGTQSGKGASLTQYDLQNGAFGQGGNGAGEWTDGGMSNGAGGAGGGGWYGGNGGKGYYGGGSGGGGGSGYIGGMPAFTGADGTVYAPGTAQGAGNPVNADGYARITFVTAGSPTITVQPTITSISPSSGRSATITWSEAQANNLNGATIYYQYFVGPSSTYTDDYYLGETTGAAAYISQGEITSKCGTDYPKTVYFFVRAYWKRGDASGGWVAVPGTAWTYDPRRAVVFNGTQITDIVFNGVTLEHFVFNGTQIY